MVLVSGQYESVRHTYFDSFQIPRNALPQSLLLFQTCSTIHDTNMELQGTIQFPRHFVIDSISMDFKYPVRSDARDLFLRTYRFEFTPEGFHGRQDLLACTVEALLDGVDTVHALLDGNKIVVSAGEHFCPKLVWNAPADAQIDFPQGICGYVRLHGNLFMEVG